MGGTDAAGIGGGNKGHGNNITINGGTITANGGRGAEKGTQYGAAGIGGGSWGNGSIITINSGEVTAKGASNAAGIGGGAARNKWPVYENGIGSHITINGGTVNATGGSDGAGIGGGRDGNGENITINGGTVTAISSADNTANLWGAAGIGGGTGANGSNIKITDGTVTAKSMAGGAGIGGGYNGNGTNIEILGGTVTAIGGTHDLFTPKNGGAGIGGGFYMDKGGQGNGAGVNITISGGSVTATGGYNAAGIGGGSILQLDSSGYADNIIINAGEVTAIGGEGGFGIGGGTGRFTGTTGAITINGGTVTVTGNNNNAFGAVPTLDNYKYKPYEITSDSTSEPLSGSDITIKQHVHRLSEWITDGSKHWKKCTVTSASIECVYIEQEATCNFSLATCTTPKTCNVCKSTSGETDSNNHTGTLSGWQNDDDNHWKTYDCCNKRINDAVHEYTNACDANCNVCSASRTPSDHVYDNACDANCNVCCASRTPSDHVYDNVFDAVCNVCGDTRIITVGSPTLTPSAKALNTIRNAKAGDTVEITLPSENTMVDAAVFKALAGKDVTLEIKSGDVIWKIYGKNIPTNLNFKNLDLGVSINTNNIPVNVINAITGESETMQISLKHNGDFGFTITMNVNLGSKNKGLFANLYYYNPVSRLMDFMTSAVIGNDGNVELDFNHASEYAVVIDDKDHGAAVVNPFTDVKAGSYYYDAVLWAVEKGITSGTSATEFSPNAKVTRGQVATFLWRANGSLPTKNAISFTDVKTGSFYAEAIAWAVDNKITNGTGTTTFSPSADCTRGQVVTFLFRSFK